VNWFTLDITSRGLVAGKSFQKKASPCDGCIAGLTLEHRGTVCDQDIEAISGSIVDD
jgi:hypothetical protein